MHAVRPNCDTCTVSPSTLLDFCFGDKSKLLFFIHSGILLDDQICILIACMCVSVSAP